MANMNLEREVVQEILERFKLKLHREHLLKKDQSHFQAKITVALSLILEVKVDLVRLA